MNLATPGEITALLAASREGDAQAETQLVNLLYTRLHQMAVGILGGEPHSLQATDLLHEAVIRMTVDGVFRSAPNRAYLLGAAARSMRQILADHARWRTSLKHGGGWGRVPLDAVLDRCERERVDALELTDALEVLSAENPREAQVFTLRNIGGFTANEVARMFCVSLSTVEKDYRFARAWLHKALGEGDDQ